VGLAYAGALRRLEGSALTAAGDGRYGL